MNETLTNNRFDIPNLLLIAGNGRNVGKTFLACKIIKQLSIKQEVIGIKISPHFHETEKNKVLFQNDKFVIIEETQFNKKDSSLMLQAGAKRVFFIMVEQENLQAAFLQLKAFLPQKAIVCESGGLSEYIKPGGFLFVKNENEKIIKPKSVKFSPVIVENNGCDFSFNTNKIKYTNNRFLIE